MRTLRDNICKKLVEDFIFYILTSNIVWRDEIYGEWKGKSTCLTEFIEESTDLLISLFEDTKFRAALTSLECERSSDLIKKNTKVEILTALHKIIPMVQNVHHESLQEIEKVFIPKLLEIRNTF